MITNDNLREQLLGNNAVMMIHERVNGDHDRNENANNNTPIYARLPRGGWIKNPFEDISFHGKSDRQNPIRFLQRFEKLALYERVSEEDQVHYFGQCMKGNASQWFELQNVETIQDVKRVFKAHFFGDAKLK